MYFGKWKKWGALALCLCGIISIFSCEIGLGSAVDVADPTSAVSYPPKNAVVRDSFVAAGDCSDDMKVTSVKVTLLQPENNKTYGPYDAKVNDSGTSWSVLLNKQDKEKASSDFDSYKQWEFPDGNYIISAVAYDSEGKSSPAATSPISIDNTAPVLVVSKPLAVGSETATIYGTSLKLSGDIAEEHETSKLVLYYKQFNNSTNAFIDSEVKSIEVTDSEELNAMSSSNPLIIAQFDKTGAISEQHNKYVTLYGATADDVDRYYYCGFMLEDNARLYQTPGDDGEGDGNQTKHYYLLGNDFQNDLAVNYSLTAQRLMEIFRGSTDSYTDSQISNIAGILLRDGNYASSQGLKESDEAAAKSQSSKFSLNPHNNPTWSLGEYGVPAGSNNIGQYIAGSSLVLTLKAGRDASFPDPRTVTVDLYDLGESDSSINGKTPIRLIGPGGLFAETWDESADDSTKKYTFVLNADSVFEKNHFYQMVVNGTDRNKTDFEPEDVPRYVFEFATSNSVPRVTITEPLDDSSFMGQTANDNGITIRGIINTDAVPLRAGEEVTISKLEISDVSNTDAVSLSITDFDYTLISCQEDPSIPHQYPFELKITSRNANGFAPEGTKYLYVATVRTKDKTGYTGERKVKFYVDNKVPDLFITEVSPVASKDDNEYVVNGMLTIKGTASDSGVSGSGLRSLSYKILNSSNVIVAEYPIGISESWEKVIDTTDTSIFADNQSYTIVVTATDTLGNSKSKSVNDSDMISPENQPSYPHPLKIKVNQATDEPQITWSNLGDNTTIFGTVNNNKLYGTVSDDDGIASFIIGTVENSNNQITLNNNSFEYTLPSVEGEYTLYIYLRDTKQETSYSNYTPQILVRVDNGAPVFSNITTDLRMGDYNLGSKPGAEKINVVSGMITDGSGVVTLIKNGDTEHPLTISGNVITGATWTDTITMPSENGTHTVVYTATDKHGQYSTYTYEYSVDVTDPVINQIKVGSSTVVDRVAWLTDNWFTQNNISLVGYIKDTGSGIKSVEYSQDGGSNWEPLTLNGSSDMPGFEKWIASVQFSDDVLKPLKFRVKDYVDNKTEQTINMRVDRTKPVLDVKWYQIADSDTASSYFTPTGNAYINNKNLIFYANYTDTSENYGENNSGITIPVFKIGNTTVFPEITYYKEAITDTTSINSVMTEANTLSYSEENARKIKSFKAVIPNSIYEGVINNEPKAVVISGCDNAGNEIENNDRVLISITNDTESPVINSTINISGSYKASNGTYFIRRQSGVPFAISGTTTDNSSIDKTEITIVGQNNTYTNYTSKTAWKFDDFNFLEWSKNPNPENEDGSINPDAVMSIKASDKAGNITSITNIPLVFDEVSPAVLTGGAGGSDPEDTSNPYTSDYTLRGKIAWKYGGISIGTGKYGDTTYGRESSIEVGITYIKEEYGSGIAKMEYKMLASSSVPDSLINITTGKFEGTLPSTWTRTGEFAFTPSTYTHYTDPEPRPARPCIVGKATISGFESTTNGKPNLLFVKATDNCGNESDWFVLLIQMDNDGPVITNIDPPLSLLTNGKSTLSTLTGTVSEGAYSSGLKALRVYIDGKLAIDGNFTKTPAAGLTIEAKDATGNILQPKKKNGELLSGWTSETASNIYNQAVEVSFKNDYGTLTYIAYKDESKTEKCSFKDAASFATWELSITPQKSDGTYSDWFNSIINKSSPQIAIEAEDWADDSTGNGNKSFEQITNFDIDIKNPAVEILSPVGNSAGILNGKQYIKGSVVENHTAEKVGVYYSTEETPPQALGSWHKIIDLTENLYSFNAGEHNFNEFINDAASGTVHILAVVHDKAGNTNVDSSNVTDEQENGKYAYRTYTVDKNSDRPVITITSSSITNNTNEDPLQLDSSILNFTVTDDDGVEEVLYRSLKRIGITQNFTNEENDNNWETVTLSASGDASIRFDDDGDYKLEFKVKDKDNSYYFTSTEQNSFRKIKITDGASTPHLYDENPTLFVRVETKLPELTIEGIQFLKTENQTLLNSNWITEGFYNYVIGGEDRKYLGVKVRARDKGTGINNVTINAKLASTDITQLADKSTAIPETEEVSRGNSIYTVIIPCTSSEQSENVNFVATVTAEDNAGKIRSEPIAFRADTKSPTITITSPETAESGTLLSGSIVVEGHISESAILSYAISPLEDYPDEYDSSTNFSYVKYNSSNPAASPTITLPGKNKANVEIVPSESLDQLCSYKPIDASNPETKRMSFYITFDGKTDDTNQSIHSDTLNTWIKNIGITTEHDLRSPSHPFDDVIQLYLHIKAEDSAGNIKRDRYPILVNPLGSRPEVSIGYPSEAQAGGDNKLTLGGKPSIIGTAAGINIPDYVWLQIDCNEDQDWTEADINTILAQKNSSNESLYTLGRMDTKETVDAYDESVDAEFYAIRVPLSGSRWSQQINLGGELNQTEGAGSTKEVIIWAYSTDMSGLISRKEVRTLIIDNKAPIIDPEIRLVKWNEDHSGENDFTVDASGAITFTAGAVSAIRPYNENDNIKGKWYVIGKVSDDSGINSISYKVNGGSQIKAIINNEALHSGTGTNEGTYIRRITGGNYIFCLPIGNETVGTVGQYSIEFSAVENGDSEPKSAERTFIIRYDNKVPEIVTELTGYENGIFTEENPLTITNSNGVFTFGGTAKEDKVGTIDQTGIERVAFYFTRNIDGQETKIFDPMIRSRRDGNPVEGNAVDYSSLSHDEDGLYWKSLTVNTSGHTITVTDAAASSAFKNIHKGGLVKIYDVIYRIDAVNASAGTVSLSEDYNLVSATGITAKFAIANVVDNPTREGEGSTKITTDYGYGYSSNGSFDDGDFMVESLIQEGTSYTWEANINSKNISDGPVVLHYVIFDKAGNYSTEKTFECFVKNNQPRLVGVILGTDQNGNGTVDTTEMINSFSGLYVNGMDGKKKVSTLTVPANAKDESASAVLKIKGKTVLKPEIVGGNGTIGYTYTVSKRKQSGGVDAGDGWDTPYKTPVTSTTIKTLGTGTADDDEHTVSLESSGGIVIDVIDFLQNEIVDDVNQKFTFTIWDSTPGRNYGTTSQNAVLNVIMDVALNDIIPAKNKITPFYWKDSEHNSLKDNSKENGHIELSKDLPEEITSKNPKVSGAFKLEGIAQDDTLLRTLVVKIGGTNYQIANYAEGNWTLGSTPDSNTGWSSEIREATYAEFIAAGFITEDDIPFDKETTDFVPETSQEYGHVVHWTMIVDTEALHITPKAGIEISVSASDIGKPKLNDSRDTVIYEDNGFWFNGPEGTTIEAVAQTGGDDGSEAQTCKYTIDVVPYITRIITKLSGKSRKDDTSEYDRTALGHYPVASTETIKIEGFNLTGESSSKIKFTSKDATTAEVNYTDDVAANGFGIPENAKSGKLSIIVDDVESLNNSNNNDARGSYAQAKPLPEDFGDDETYEKFCNYYNCRPNEQNNYILTDDVEIDIWEFKSSCAIANPSGRVDEPILKINPDTGIMGFAFLSSSMYVSAPTGKNNSYKDKGGTGATGDFRSTMALAYDWRGWSYFMEAGGNEGDRIRFWAIKADGNNGWTTDFEKINQTGTRAQNGGGSSSNLRYKVRSPSIATSPRGTNNANIYMAYYDSYNDEIRFMSGDNTNRDLFVARARDGYNCKNAQVIATDASKNLPSGDEYQYTDTPLGKAGEFVCIDVIPAGTEINGAELANDVVVIVWYETSTGNLKYSYNTSPRDISWRTDNTDIDENYRGLNRQNWEDAKTIFTGAGEYCKVSVDGKGGIHIAGYDKNSGDLRYAYLPSYDSSYTESSMSYIVDSSGNAGAHLTMDVALVDEEPVPYISYIGANIPKIAYLKDPINASTLSAGTSNDMFTGAWEVSYLPVTSTVPDMDYKKLINNLDNRINVAVWKKKVGTLNGVLDDSKTGTNTVEKTSGTCWGNGTKNPVVAYSIAYDSANDSIESAQKR